MALRLCDAGDAGGPRTGSVAVHVAESVSDTEAPGLTGSGGAGAGLGGVLSDGPAHWLILARGRL